MLPYPRLAFSTLALALGAALAGPAAAADLMEVYELARANDPVIGAVDAQRLAIGENVVQARALLLPNINGTASLTDSDSESTFIDSIPSPDGSVNFGPGSGEADTKNRTYRVTLLQSIFNFANYTRLASTRALKSRAEADYEAALDNLFTRVATAYFGILTARSNLEAAEAETKAVGRQLEQADQRFEVGLTAITDVHEARARADNARANQILAENQLNSAYELLFELTGQRIENVEPLDETIPMAAPEPADLDEWVKVANEESPVLASRRFALQSSEHDIRTAKAGHLPRLDGSVVYTDNSVWGRRSSNDFSFPADQTFEDVSVGVTLTVPIFEGFATQSRVRQSVHNRDINADLLETDRRAVERTTRNAYRAVIAGISEVEARKQALVSAQSALEATEAGFEVGTRTIVDVLLSQQQLFFAQREYNRARHTYVVAGLILKQTAGVIDVADIQQVNALLD